MSGGLGWVERMAPYKQASNSRAMVELAITITPLIPLWLAMWYALDISIWLTLVLALPTAGFVVRLFCIQHDCGHGAMFSSKIINDWVGRVIGVFTFTPYDYWKHSHALHHVSSGNLDKRGFGDIDTKTVEEYLAMGWVGRLLYRVYRNPIVMFVIGPAYLFFLKQRLPFEMLDRGWAPWVSTLATNAGIVAVFSAGMYFVGVREFLILQLVTVFLAGAIGIWLFYVQHQYEETQWDRAENWKRENCALMGSSYYDLPKPFMWLTAYLGIHHVHHLASQVPYYRLPKIVEKYPELKEIGRLTFWQSLKCIPLTLWDERTKRLISFGELRRLPIGAAQPAE